MPAYNRWISSSGKKKATLKKPSFIRVNIATQELFELISIDYIHLNKSKGSYEYLIIVGHNCTKYIQGFPIKSKSGQAAADVLFNKYFLDHDFPKHTIHNQGREINCLNI